MSLRRDMFIEFMHHLQGARAEEAMKAGYRCELPNLGYTSLHKMCYSKSPEALHKFLKLYNGSVDIVDPYSGVTPLVTACKLGNLATVELLVQRGANVDHSCCGINNEDMKYSNITPLYVAAEEGHVSIVKYLGERGADVNVQMSPLGFTPLHRAVFNKHITVISILIEKFKAKVSIPCVETPGSYPVYSAIVVGDSNILKTLLSAEDADPNVPDPTEQVTALHFAAYKGDIPAAEILISSGANVNAQLKSGHSPLDLAVQEKKKDMAECLRLYGAQRKTLDRTWHPFVYCVVHGLRSMKKAISRGADINSLISPIGGTALHFCVDELRMDACKFLIQNGADLERRDVFGWTPLHCATLRGLNNYIEFLLKKGANINAQTSTGITPLHFAAFEGHLATCKLLISKGADLEVMADEVGPPVIGAVLHSHTNVMELLLKSGANPNAKNAGGTVLQIAVQFAANKPEIIKALIDAGADVRASIVVNRVTLSYLHIAPLLTDNVESLKLLIEAGAFLDSQSIEMKRDNLQKFSLRPNRPRRGPSMLFQYNGTPLQYVKKHGRPALVRLLKNTDNLFKAVRKDDLALAEKYHARGGLVNCCSVRYDTPLNYASWNGLVKMVKFLLAKGAKIDMPNVLNSSPLHHAAKCDQKAVVIELLKAGVPIDLARSNKTPLELAQEHNHSDVVAILEFTKKYLIESRSHKISPVPDWKSDPNITKVVAEFDGKISEKDLDALFE